MKTTIIIPIHEFNDNVSKYLDKAIESIVKQREISELPKLIIIFSTKIKDAITTHINDNGFKQLQGDVNITLINNEGNSNYQSQVNLAVKSVTTEYFSVLEFDDEYSLTFFKNVETYIKSYPDIDIFLTMMIEVNEQNQGIKYTNEVIWAQQFVGENGEMGYLNPNVLKQFTDFKLSGAVIRKSEFENIGGYKSNIKLAFMYELLLRALNNTCKIYTIPKIGYKHVTNREGSLFNHYLNDMPINERKFWFDTATKEANFVNDREIDLSKISGAIIATE